MREHLKPYEAAARILCSMDGIDPDTPVATPHPLINGMTVEHPTWHDAAEALVGLSKMLAALRMAAQQPQTAENAPDQEGEQLELFPTLQ